MKQSIMSDSIYKNILVREYEVREYFSKAEQFKSNVLDVLVSSAGLQYIYLLKSKFLRNSKFYNFQGNRAEVSVSESSYLELELAKSCFNKGHLSVVFFLNSRFLLSKYNLKGEIDFFAEGNQSPLSVEHKDDFDVLLKEVMKEHSVVYAYAFSHDAEYMYEFSQVKMG